jgi:hypothetical protein
VLAGNDRVYAELEAIYQGAVGAPRG